MRSKSFPRPQRTTAALRSIIDTFFYQRFSVEIPQMFAETGMTVYTAEFSGARCDAKLNELVECCKALPEIPDAVIGIGGGQACDITKAAWEPISAKPLSWYLPISLRAPLLPQVPLSTIPASKIVP